MGQNTSYKVFPATRILLGEDLIVHALYVLTSWRGVHSLQNGYYVAVNFILSSQCTLGDRGKVLSRDSIPIKSCFQTEIAHKPNTSD